LLTVELDLTQHSSHLLITTLDNVLLWNRLNIKPMLLRRKAKGALPWKPIKPRERQVLNALKVYGMLAASADKGGVRILPEGY